MLIVLIADFPATNALGAVEARRRHSRSSLLLICSRISHPPFFKNHLQFGASSGGTHRSSGRDGRWPGAAARSTTVLGSRWKDGGHRQGQQQQQQLNSQKPEQGLKGENCFLLTFEPLLLDLYPVSEQHAFCQANSGTSVALQVSDPKRGGLAFRGSGLHQSCGSVSDLAAAVGPGQTCLLHIPGAGERPHDHQPASQGASE